MSTTTRIEPPVSTDDRVLTPRARTVARRGLFWAGVAGVCLVVVVASMLLTRGGATSGLLLDPADPAPTGAKAIAEVLRNQGVDVILPDGYDEALAASSEPGTTLALYDPSGYLAGDRLTELAGVAGDVVLLSPGFRHLQAVAPAVRAAGPADQYTPLDADCGDGAAARAGTISPGSTFADSEGSDAIRCFPADTGGFGLLGIQDGSDRIWVLGPSDALSNDLVLLHGNAALGLGLLGGSDRLVWYLPSIADVEASGPPSLAELTPTWLVPVTSLCAITVLVAMFWRGRRFGPLVAEDLPVTVPAGETMEGRSRLYQRSAARTRAVDALRIGAVGRLGDALGLSRHASVGEVSDAVASALGRNPGEVRGILLDDLPGSERDVVALSDTLRDLESAVAAAVDPRPPTRPR
ncbi:DUF4350 domain-containing protein [Mycetocola miduiensis]|uniref:DUF4350 domain-containing protein n=1 Tax=Mycetocola miduiensis TaxID=995034 RepID=A0A1I5E2K0_9MICO|nr:DUF4350 domain-containing protein [Mycetocola miduiensis]SFO05728.1 protein of unknown function [Mycetocola miduiensis]